MVPEMPRKNGKTTTGSGGEFPPPLDPAKNWQWVEPGMSADLAMRKGGGLAFSAVDLARPGSKDKSVMVTGVRREDGTIEVTGEMDLEGFVEWHRVACPKARVGRDGPCAGEVKWTIFKEDGAFQDLAAAFGGQTCLEAFEDFVEWRATRVRGTGVPALSTLPTLVVGELVKAWLRYELQEEREYQARIQPNSWASARTVESPTKPLTEEMLHGLTKDPRKDCAHAGRRKVYRAPLGGDPDSSKAVVVEDKCVDCGAEFMKSRAKEPEQFVAPKYDGARCPCGFPDVYRGPCTMHGSADPKAMPGFTGKVRLYAGTAKGPEHPVLAEAGPSKVGERVEGCARCRRRTPGRSFCSSCGDRSTSFELRPGESGW